MVCQYSRVSGLFVWRLPLVLMISASKVPIGETTTCEARKNPVSICSKCYFIGARGRNRTTDTRIFKPKLIERAQQVKREESVKPTTAHQAVSGELSNLGIEAIQ